MLDFRFQVSIPKGLGIGDLDLKILHCCLLIFNIATDEYALFLPLYKPDSILLSTLMNKEFFIPDIFLEKFSKNLINFNLRVFKIIYIQKFIPQKVHP
jgi:hypothetical protein